jgi:hypothetical protein
MVQAAWEFQKGREALPPEAVERITDAVAERSGSKLTRAFDTKAQAWRDGVKWTRAGVLAVVVVASSLAMHVVDRLTLLGEVARVEAALGQAMNLTVASNYLEMMRLNPDGVVVEKVVKVDRGGEVAVGRWWKTLPQPVERR